MVNMLFPVVTGVDGDEMMPTTDDDDALIAAMPPGTTVWHWKHGRGTAFGDVQFGQVLVQFDNHQVACFCYVSNLDIDPSDGVDGDG